MNALVLLFLLSFGVFLVLAIASKLFHEEPTRSLSRKSRQRNQQTLTSRLTRVANHLPNGRRFRTGHNQVVEGRLMGRQVSLQSLGNDVVYAVEAPRLRGRELTFTQAQGAFQVDYEANPAGATYAARLVADPLAKHALSSLTQDQGLREVRLSGGQVSGIGRGGRLTPSRAKRVFRDLHKLALSAEQLRVQVQASVRTGKSIDWSTRMCPYCRDGLDDAQRVACERCDTVLHAECFSELGRCPTAACEGTRGFPVTHTHERAKVVIGAAPCNECGLRAQGCRPGGCQASRAEQALHRIHAGRRTRRV